MSKKNKEVQQQIRKVGIIPVLRATSSETAIMAAKAVCQGGIPIVEITMTVPDAVQVIAELTLSLSRQVMIGAGTVMDAETVKQCANAGAQFIVSPVFNPDVVNAARDQGLVMMAGALTPTEILAASNGGSDFVKVFPCGNVGGASYIRAIKTVLPQIQLVPTGGVTLANVGDYLDSGASAVGVGGELVWAGDLTGDFEGITAAARRFAAAVSEQQERARPPRVA